LLTKEENSRYERQAVSSISTALLRAKMETQARGIRMVLVVHPLKGEADSKHFSNRFMDTLLVAVGELAPVNLLPYFADSISGDNKSEKYYWKNDAHFNPEGYHIMAERIKKEVFP
jgi:lysophospholipase L1-like esterase